MSTTAESQQDRIFVWHVLVLTTHAHASVRLCASKRCHDTVSDRSPDGQVIVFAVHWSGLSRSEQFERFDFVLFTGALGAAGEI